MKVHRTSITERVTVPAADLFDLITDPARLPVWNEHIDHVVAIPDDVVTGSEWIVEIHALGRRWNSRATCESIDATARCFAYVSRSDDDNPSRARWTWRLTTVEGATEVTVDLELRPKTTFRRFVGAPIRFRQLDGEVRRSVHAAAAVVATDLARPDRT